MTTSPPQAVHDTMRQPHPAGSGTDRFATQAPPADNQRSYPTPSRTHA